MKLAKEMLVVFAFLWYLVRFCHCIKDIAVILFKATATTSVQILPKLKY